MALQGGIVGGAGTCISKAADKITKDNGIGGDILYKALRYPFNLILENMGITDIESLSGKFVNIYDPAIVVKNSITNAISVAGSVLTAKAIITR